MARVSSLRDGERWEQVGVAVATNGAKGAAGGLGLARKIASQSVQSHIMVIYYY